MTRIALAGLVVIASLVLPAGAQASSVQRPAGTDAMFFRAVPGETNHLSVSLLPGGSTYMVEDAGNDLVAGPGCNEESPSSASCAARPDDFWSVYLYDGNDDATFDLPLNTLVCGGRGADSLAFTG